MTVDAPRRLLPIWTLALAGTVLAVTARWLTLDDLPDGYQNEFIHLYTLGEIWFRQREGGLAEASPFLWDEYYPPLLHAPAALAMTVFGRSRAVAVLAQALWILPLLFSAASLARRLADERAALLAVTVLAFAPAVFGNLRRYEPNIALSACVALALAVLAAPPSRRRALLFGLVCGMGLMVDRLVFAVYLAAPGALMLWRRRRWVEWGMAAGVALLLCGYYYQRFLLLHLGEITSQLGGEVTATGDLAQGFPLLSLRGSLYYPLSWVDGGLGLPFALLVGAGWLLWVRIRSAGERDARDLLESCLVAGLVGFTLLGKKQPYYAIPLLTPAVVLAAAGWARALAGRGWIGALTLTAALGANQLIFLSRGEGLVPMPGRWAVLGGASPLPPRFLGHEYVMAGPPFTQGLQLERAAELCAGAVDADRPLTLLFSEGHGAYEGQVMPTLRLLLDTRRVPGMLMEPQAWEESAPFAGCFVYIARSDARWPSEASIAPVFAQWDYAPPTAGLLGALDAVRARSRLLGRWTSELGETVHVYALGPGIPLAPG